MSSPLIDELVRRGRLDPERVSAFERHLAAEGGTPDTVLLELGYVEESELISAMAVAFDAPVAGPDVASTPVDPMAARAFPEQWAKKHTLAPLELDRKKRTLTLLTLAPVDLALLAQLAAMLDLEIVPLIAPEVRVRQRLAILYGLPLPERAASLLARVGSGSGRPRSRPAPPATGERSSDDSALKATLTALRHAEGRDQIIDLALTQARRDFDVVALLVVQEGRVVGKKALGTGAEHITEVVVQREEHSAFWTAVTTQGQFLGPLPASDLAALAPLSRAQPRAGLIIPLRVRDRVIGVLFAENGPRAISPRAASELMLLSNHVQQALEGLLLRRKSGLPTEARLSSPPKPAPLGETTMPGEVAMSGFPSWISTPPSPKPQKPALLEDLLPLPNGPKWDQEVASALELRAARPAPYRRAKTRSGDTTPPTGTTPLPPIDEAAPTPSMEPTSGAASEVPVPAASPGEAEPVPSPPGAGVFSALSAPAGIEPERAEQEAEQEGPEHRARAITARLMPGRFQVVAEERTPIPAPYPEEQEGESRIPDPIPDPEPVALTDLVDNPSLLGGSAYDSGYSADGVVPTVPQPGTSQGLWRWVGGPPPGEEPPADSGGAPEAEDLSREAWLRTSTRLGNDELTPVVPEQWRQEDETEPPITDLVVRGSPTPQQSEEQLLVEQLGSDDPVLRESAINALLWRGPAVFPALARVFPGRIDVDPFRSGRPTPPFEACGGLLELVSRFGPEAHPMVGEILDDPAPIRRFFALYFYASFKNPDAIPRLIRRLHDEESRIASMAIEVLSSFRQHPAFQQVIDHLHSRLSSQSPVARRQAMRFLALFRDVSAVPAMIQVFERREKTLYDAAEEALEELTKQSLGRSEKRWRAWWERQAKVPRVFWLLDGLESSDPRLRKSSAMELRELSGLDVGYDPAASKRERDDAKRRWAAWANAAYGSHHRTTAR